MSHASAPSLEPPSVPLHGLVAEFTEPHAVLAAAKRAHAEGYRIMEAYTPFPVEGLPEAIGFRRNGVPLACLLGGIFGGLLGFAMQTYAATFDYRLDVGGRPPFSWPAFVPITFELTVLCAAFGAIFGMLTLNGLPRPHHPIFETPNFESRNASRFYLCIEVTDPAFHRERTRQFLQGCDPQQVWEVHDAR